MRARLTYPLLALALGAGAAACSRKDADAKSASDSAPAAMEVGVENIAVVQSTSIETGPAISGALAPEREAAVRAQVGGAVLETLVDEGQRVSAGQTLARLDASGIQDAFLSARSGVSAAENSAEVAKRDLERAEKLVAAGAIAERDVEQARRGNVAAQAAVADARARLAAAQRQVENTRVTAPFAGIVSQKQANAGDVVQPGGALYTVVDPSSMRLEASVPAEQLQAVRVGMPVRFTVTGYEGRTFEGRVTRVNPIADPATRQVKIIATLPNAGSTLVGGLFAEGRVSSETRTGPVVPVSAVDEKGLRPAVMRVKGGKVERAEIELGIRDAATETVEVKAGLAAGDTILIGAARGLSAGTAVRISTPTDR